MKTNGKTIVKMKTRHETHKTGQEKEIDDDVTQKGEKRSKKNYWWRMKDEWSKEKVKKEKRKKWNK